MNWPWLDVPPDEERIVRFLPAFHRCTDPKGNFGIGGVRMLWILKVGNHAVGWEILTDWGQSRDAFNAQSPGCKHAAHQDGYPAHRLRPSGVVDFHSPVPQYDDQPLSQEQCPVNGGPCFLDSGFLLGSELFDVLTNEGDEAVWKRLRELLDGNERP